MSLELPDWLVTAFNVLGLPWPGIDEDQLRAWATSLRRFANEVTDSSGKTHQTIAALADDSQSSFTDALAEKWEHHNKLLAELHGPMDDFAEALDVAADVVVAQKYAVIAAASAMAAEFVSTQIGAFFTFGADEAAVPFEIATTREAVKFAWEVISQELMQKLMGYGAQKISGSVNSFLSNLMNDALGVQMEVQGLKVSYDRLNKDADSIRSQADETDDAGKRAYGENAERDLQDSSEGSDSEGMMSAIIKGLELGLKDIAISVFQHLPSVIMKAQEDDANLLGKYAEAMKGVDDGLHPPHEPTGDGDVSPAPETTSVETLNGGIPYGNTDISRAAINFRFAQRVFDTNLNVAIYKVRLPDDFDDTQLPPGTVDAGDGTKYVPFVNDPRISHSEQEADAGLTQMGIPPDAVEDIYSERVYCTTKGHECAGIIAKYKNTAYPSFSFDSREESAATQIHRALVNERDRRNPPSTVPPALRRK